MNLSPDTPYSWIIEHETGMKHPTIIVRADWDDEANVWFATSTDVDGLAAEAATLEALRAKVLTMVVELMELNA